jgi:hypothetical protein
MTRFQQTPSGERAEIGMRARQFTMERFGLESVLDRWEVLYQELLALNPEPRRWGRRAELAPVRRGQADVF